MTNTTDPRVIAGAKAWDKHMGGRYSPDEVEELADEVAVILAAADAVDPSRKSRTVTTIEEVDALPLGSVVIDSFAAVCVRINKSVSLGWRRCTPAVAGGEHRHGPYLPATVLGESEA